MCLILQPSSLPLPTILHLLPLLYIALLITTIKNMLTYRVNIILLKVLVRTCPQSKYVTGKFCDHDEYKDNCMLYEMHPG